MKAFRFRLEQALRWRKAQAEQLKATAAAAADRVSALNADLEARELRLRADSEGLTQTPDTEGFQNWAAYLRRAKRESAGVEKQLREADRLLGEQMRLLVEANRKVRLLEKLRENAAGRWNAEMQREIEAFASEAFLGRLQSKEHSGA